MNLTPDIIKTICDAAKAYDAATDADERASLGAKLDALADQLSDGQLKQVCKMVNRL